MLMVFAYSMLVTLLMKLACLCPYILDTVQRAMVFSHPCIDCGYFCTNVHGCTVR